MDRSELINKILSDLDLDKIYSFYNAFGDVSDPEYYKKIPSFIQYPEVWKNKPLTVDLIKTSLLNIINNILNSKYKSKEDNYYYYDGAVENGFSIAYSENSFMMSWFPIYVGSITIL